MNSLYLKRFLLVVVFFMLGSPEPVRAMSEPDYPIVKDIATELGRVQSGDWVFFDIDNTLLFYSFKSGIGQVKDINPQVKNMIQELRDYSQGKIKFFALTARNSQRSAQDDLEAMGYALDGIITAPGNKIGGCGKGDSLVTFLKSQSHLPNSIWFFDDLTCQLKDVQERLSVDGELNKIPLKLYQVKFYRKF
jgi:hypothetical protein